MDGKKGHKTKKEKIKKKKTSNKDTVKTKFSFHGLKLRLYYYC